MTDTAGDNKPFPGFPGFPPAEMLDKMWDMMRLTPFGAAFPGMTPGMAQGLGSPLTAMSDMMTPLMNVEELDKRITDMRAVEQWLKLNLNMLQSAIQALEVQRATLATLRAFGAFAQASMAQPAQGDTSGSSAQPSSAWGARPPEREAPGGANAAVSGGSAGEKGKVQGTEQGTEQVGATSAAASLDPSAWWNLLQAQFNQLASLAMSQPAAGAPADAAERGKAEGAGDPPVKAARATGASAGKNGASRAKPTPTPTPTPTPRRPAARRSSGKTAGSSSASSREK
jgi:hypothetical protein